MTDKVKELSSRTFPKSILQQIAKELNVSGNGNKETIAQRIVERYLNPTSQTEQPVSIPRDTRCCVCGKKKTLETRSTHSRCLEIVKNVLQNNDTLNSYYSQIFERKISLSLVYDGVTEDSAVRIPLEEHRENKKKSRLNREKKRERKEQVADDLLIDWAQTTEADRKITRKRKRNLADLMVKPQKAPRTCNHLST